MNKLTAYGRVVFVLVASVLLTATITAADTPGPKHLVEFTLAATGGDSVPGAFSLALRRVDPSSFGSPGGGYIEDCVPPYDTAFGCLALSSETTGGENTAFGYWALKDNTSGGGNTAVGNFALQGNQHGNNNTAFGHSALRNNIGGTYNTAIGLDALAWNNGSANTVVGHGAFNGLYFSGKHNTALGTWAGTDCANGQYHWNIYIGSMVRGQLGDNNTIRIGIPHNAAADPPEGQNKTYIAGIVESPLTAEMTPAVVGITGEGRLGTIPSDLLPPEPLHGSLLFLPANVEAPDDYVFIGSTFFTLTLSNKKTTKLTVNVFQKQ